jgi:uncharacterized protein YjbI with pentapeptide repeats
MEIRDLNEPIEARDSDLGRSAFVGVMLKEARFEDVGLLPGARFSNVNLSGACFTNVNLAGGAIQDANLAGVSISNCNIAGLRVDGVLVSDALAAYRKTV